jgi:hypothetical protein
MASTAGVAGLDRFDRCVIAGAVAVLLLPVGLVGSSISSGLARELHDALTRPVPLCSEGMSLAVTAQGDRICVSRDVRLPRRWTWVTVAD